MFAAIAGLVHYLAYGVWEPILGLRLADYDLSQISEGLVFSILPLFYLIGTLVNPYVVPSWVETRIILFTSLLMLSVCCLLTAPLIEGNELV